MIILEGGVAKSKSVHPSIAALLAAHPGETDPKHLIRRLAREKVVHAKAQKWEGPPFCPKHFTSIFGIRCKEVHHDIGADGRILLHPGGKVWIEYRTGQLPERQRFTIFHEFAHTLFPDYCQFAPHHHNSRAKASDPEKKFESLCDVAAAEMLMPDEDFSRDLAASGRVDFDVIHTLRKNYQASIDATTHRIMDLLGSVSCAAVFMTDQKGDFQGGGPLWVKYMSPNREFKGYLQPGTLPPWNSVVLECFKSGIETTGSVKETWWINGRPRSWLVQAAKLPVVPTRPDYAKVVALLLPSSYGAKQRKRN